MKNRIKKIVATLLIIISMLALCACKDEIAPKPKLELKDCLTVEFSGYNGFGKAKLTVDENAINAQVDAEKFSEYIDPYLPSSLLKGITLAKTLRIELKESCYNLSNGDTVTIAVSLPETLKTQGVTFKSMSEAIGLTVEAVEISFTVSGLKEAEVLDISSFIEENIKFEGANGSISPKVFFDENFSFKCGNFYFRSNQTFKNQLDIIYNNEFIGDLSYICKENNLSRKDKFKITVSSNSMKTIIDTLSSENYIIDETSFEFTVPDNVSDYVTEKEQLTKEVVDQLDKSVLTKIKEKTYLSDVEIVERYLVTVKPGGVTYHNAKSYHLSIIKATEPGYFSRGTVYVVAPAYDVTITVDGKIEAEYNNYDFETYTSLKEIYSIFDNDKDFSFEKYN